MDDESVSAENSFFPVPKTLITKPNEPLGECAETRAFTIPNVIPSDASAVLIYAGFYSGDANNVEQDIKISVNVDGVEYAKYLYNKTGSQVALNTNSENMWFPMPSGRTVYVTTTVATAANNTGLRIFVTGYRGTSQTSPQQAITSTQSTAVKKINEIGGRGGSSFDDYAQKSFVAVKAVQIRHSNQIDAIQVQYILPDGSLYFADRHGGGGGSQTNIEFEYGENITEIEILTNRTVVDQMKFTTTNFFGSKRVYGPFGTPGRRPTVHNHTMAKLVGFHGSSGDLLDALGFYYVE